MSEPTAEINADTTSELGEQVSVFVVTIFQVTPNAMISTTLSSQLRRELADTITTPRERTRIELWLESPGGDAHAAYKIGVLLRAYAHEVHVVIPDYAKSAATLLTLVGDVIFMAPTAELGPLDAQIQFEQEGMTISALDRVNSLEDLTDQAIRTAIGGGALVLNYTRLSRAEAMAATLDFSAKFFAPIVAKFDPTLWHWSNTLLRVASEYGKRLLATRQGDLGDTGEDIPEKLLKNYPTHGFVIDAGEATKLGLPVRPLKEYSYYHEVLALHQQSEAQNQNIVSVFNVEDAVRREGPDDEDRSDDTHDENHGEEAPVGDDGNAEVADLPAPEHSATEAD